MDGDGADRFGAFVNALAEVVGHADRVRPLRDYCMGLLTPAERKSVEPLAAVTAPSRVSAQHQSLLHFVASRSCAGASSGTTRNSNRSSGSGTLRDEVGEASITMPPFASPPTPSWSPNGRGFPPQNRRVSSRRLQFPPVRPGDRPPIRPERHVANSISTMRRTLIVDLVRKLERCPCCTAVIRIPVTL